MSNYREDDKSLCCPLCGTILEVIAIDENGYNVYGCPDVKDCGYQEGD